MLQLPKKFEERFAFQFGDDELSRLNEGLSNPLSPAIRRHHSKGFSPSLRSIPWCSLGSFVDREVIFGADPFWHAGAYYVQEPGSMIIAQFIEQLGLAPHRAIDLCAAPGGKSSLLRSYLPSDCIVIANEINSSRARILLENLTRWGLEETIVTSASPLQLKSSGITADFILVDAPCSGEGMFRKEPSAISEWSEDNVSLCVSRQVEILDEAWAMLEEGGVLLYSTCTYNREENEGQLKYLLNKYSAKLLRIELNPEWGIWEHEEGVYRFMPHRVESEGFTIFGVRKLDSTMSCSCEIRVPQSKVPSEISNIFEENSLYQHGSQWFSLSQKGQEILGLLKGIKILCAGVPIGEVKGKGWIPNQAWANSYCMMPRIPYPTYELDKEEVLRFLKREALSIEGEKGYHLVTFEGVALGFVKQVGGRANNLYPKEMMIRNGKLSINDIPKWF